MEAKIVAAERKRHGHAQAATTYLPRPKGRAAGGHGPAAVAGGATLTPPFRRRAADAPASTVAALRPQVAVLLAEDARVDDAVQAMAERRTDCVLVTDATGRLCGILTDKDIVYKVVAEGVDPRAIGVRDVMTRRPTAVGETTSLVDALGLMVSGHFRHLPVVLDDAAEAAALGTNIVGVLDIAKCTWEALQKLDKVLEGSRKLQEALDIFEHDVGHSPMEAAQARLRDMAQRLSADAGMTTLHQAIFERGLDHPPVPYTTKIREIAVLLRQRRTTGILIKDHATLKGIFTTKDVVFKVLKHRMDPGTTSVVRFMTRSPETIGADHTVLDALRAMHTGGFFHLPVVDPLNGNAIAGIVNVLQLTHYILEQLPAILGVADRGRDQLLAEFLAAPQPAPQSSRTGQDVADDAASSVDGATSAAAVSAAASGAYPQYDIFNFKLRDARSGQVFRFTSRTTTLRTLLLTIAEKLGLLRQLRAAPPALVRAPDSGLDLGTSGGEAAADDVAPEADLVLSDMTVFYEDDEGDRVLLANDHDLMEALALAHRLGWSKLPLYYLGDNCAVDAELDSEHAASATAPRASAYKRTLSVYVWDRSGRVRPAAAAVGVGAALAGAWFLFRARP